MREFLSAAKRIGCLVALTCAAGYPAHAAPTFKTLYGFCLQSGCTDGVNPEAGVVQDASGNLYGVTQGGGSAFGTVFELVPGKTKWTYKQVYSFCAQQGCVDGVSPRAALIVDTAGNLYGTTSGGGANGGGVAFELTKKKNIWTLLVLHAFCSEGGSACTDGSQPSGTDIGASGSLAYSGAAAGQLYDGTSPLYGTTETGGANNAGVAFVLTQAAGTWSESVVYSFCAKAECADGASAGNLILANEGLLYGTTALGDGSVFMLKLNAKKTKWKLTTLYGFCKQSGCTDGHVPAGLVMDGTGMLFGTTFSGGNSGTFCFFASGCGTVFNLLPKGKHSVENVIIISARYRSAPTAHSPYRVLPSTVRVSFSARPTPAAPPSASMDAVSRSSYRPERRQCCTSSVRTITAQKERAPARA